MTTHKRQRIILAIPDELLEIVEDYRASGRPVKSRNAAILDLIGDSVIRWMADDGRAEVRHGGKDN